MANCGSGVPRMPAVYLSARQIASTLQVEFQHPVSDPNHTATAPHRTQTARSSSTAVANAAPVAAITSTMSSVSARAQVRLRRGFISTHGVSSTSAECLSMAGTVGNGVLVGGLLCCGARALGAAVMVVDGHVEAGEAHRFAR